MRDPVITKWLGGIEPAWTMLDQESLAALRYPPSPVFGPIRLATDLTPEEIQRSAIARNALILLRAAAAGEGLKLTATGNLARAVVAEMCDRTMWPGFDMADAFQYNKVINEPDFLPLFFLRHLVAAGKLVRRYKGHLRATPAGRKMSREPNVRALQAMLFHMTFWYLDLGYLSRGPLDGWPQRDAGTVLWSLSVAAHDWQTPERLTRLCTIPVGGLLDRPWDTTSFATEAQILQPLTWFGLLEHQDKEREPGQVVARRLYRKTALFDRFLSFDIQLPTPGTPRH
jgi:hypothetical protein